MTNTGCRELYSTIFPPHHHPITDAQNVNIEHISEFGSILTLLDVVDCDTQKFF